jgi:hypothetical protein
MQSADFDLNPVDVLTGRMVETEKALDYFSGNDFRGLAQATSIPLLLLREVYLSAGQLWAFRTPDPSTKTLFRVHLE